MNPCSADQGGAEDYAGSEALDPALADRFALFVKAPDWDELSDEERRARRRPGGRGPVADDGGAPAAGRRGLALGVRRGASDRCPRRSCDYVTTAVSALNTAGDPRLAAPVAASWRAACSRRPSSHGELSSGSAGSSSSPACRTPAGACSPRGRRWRRPTGWLGTRVQRRRTALAPRLSGREGPRPEARHPHRHCRVPRRRHAGCGRSFSPPSRRSAPRPLPSRSIRPPPAGNCRSGRRGQRPRPGRHAVLSVDGTITLAGAAERERTRASGVERFAEALGRSEGGRAERARQFFNGASSRRLSGRRPGRPRSEIEQCVELLRRRGLA